MFYVMESIIHLQIMFTEVSKKIMVKKLDLSKKEASTLCQAVVLNDFNCWKQVFFEEILTLLIKIVS